MEKQRIYISCPWTELDKDERMELCRLLVKAGYTVRFGRERRDGKNTYEYYVEYWRDGK